MTEQVQRRVVAHRRAVLQYAAEVTGNVSRTCRYYGISRATFCKCLRRYEVQVAGAARPVLASVQQSSGDQRRGRRTIMYARQSYHFGP